MKMSLKSVGLMLVIIHVCASAPAYAQAIADKGSASVVAADKYAGKSLVMPGGSSLRIPEISRPDGDFDCSSSSVHCVPGEFRNLQAATDEAQAGDVVLAEAGRHSSFVIDKTGTAEKPIRFIARPGAVIDRFRETEHAIEIRSDFTSSFYTDYIHIIGFTFDSPPGKCIGFLDAISTRPTRGHVISENKCFSAGEDGFYLSQVSNSYVAHNYIADSGRGPLVHGIYFSNGGTGNNVVYGNVIVGSENNGIHCNGDRSVDYLEDESRGGARGTDGLVSGMIFDSNQIFFSGQSGINLDGVQESIFINNVIHGSRRHGIRGYAIDGSAGPADLSFANNTFIGNRSAIKMTEPAGSGGFLLLNNLFVDHADDAIVIEGDYLESSSVELKRADFVNPAKKRVSLEQSFTLDYRLESSLADRVRNKGRARLKNLDAPTLDLYGVERRNTPDIGAVEHR